MKNIEINTKAVKKIFAAGLLAFTMAGCAGNNEPTKEETSQGEKTEEKIDNNEITYLTEKETQSLEAGDVFDYGKLPDRKVLEEKKLDYITICDNYTYTTTDFNEEPKNTAKFEYDGEVETYIMAGEESSNYNMINSYLNEKREVVWYVYKPLKVKIISFEYVKDENGKMGKEITLNGQTFVEELLCEECVKTYQK